jgi:hypothetical protein
MSGRALSGPQSESFHVVLTARQYRNPATGVTVEGDTYALDVYRNREKAEAHRRSLAERGDAASFRVYAVMSPVDAFGALVESLEKFPDYDAESVAEVSTALLALA